MCILNRTKEGQDEKKSGIWLNDYFIVDADTDNMSGSQTRSRTSWRRDVILGQYDEDLGGI